MTYAHYISPTEVSYPDYAKPPFYGVPNVRDNDTLHRHEGYIPLVGEHTPAEGHKAVPTGFALIQKTETRTEMRDRDPVTGEPYGEWREVEVTCDTSYIQVTAWRDDPIEIPVEDYDIALEDYCREVREARGYTTNLPTDYYNSTVPRWAQDAIDYGRFRDEVLLYGLEVENRHAAGEPVPTLDEFKTHLRTIECHWTYNITEE